MSFMWIMRREEVYEGNQFVMDQYRVESLNSRNCEHDRQTVIIKDMGQTQQTYTNRLSVSFSGHTKFQTSSVYLLIHVVRDLGVNKYGLILRENNEQYWKGQQLFQS